MNLDFPDLRLLARILRVGDNTPYAKLLTIAEGAVRRSDELALSETLPIMECDACGNHQRAKDGVACGKCGDMYKWSGPVSEKVHIDAGTNVSSGDATSVGGSGEDIPTDSFVRNCMVIPKPGETAIFVQLGGVVRARLDGYIVAPRREPFCWFWEGQISRMEFGPPWVPLYDLR